MKRLRRLACRGRDEVPVHTDRENNRQTIRIELVTSDSHAVESLFDRSVYELKPGTTRHFDDSALLTFEGAVIEKVDRSRWERVHIRVRTRLTVSIPDRAAIPRLAEWLHDRLPDDRDTMVLVEGEHVGRDTQLLVTKLTTAFAAGETPV